MIEINDVLLHIFFAVQLPTEHCTCCSEQHVITHTCWNPVILGLERLQQLADRIGIFWCTVWLWQGCMQQAIYSWGQKSAFKTRACSANHSAHSNNATSPAVRLTVLRIPLYKWTSVTVAADFDATAVDCDCFFTSEPCCENGFTLMHCSQQNP